MDFKNNTSKCTECGAKIIYINQRSKLFVCPECRSLNDLYSNEIVSGLNRHFNKSPVSIGWEGKFENEKIRVLNRIRYAETGEKWDEFLLFSTGGRYIILAVENGIPILFEGYTPPENMMIMDKPSGFARVRRGRIVQMDGEIHLDCKRNDIAVFYETEDYRIMNINDEQRYYKRIPADWNIIKEIFGRLNALPYTAHLFNGTVDSKASGCIQRTFMILILAMGIIAYFIRLL